MSIDTNQEALFVVVVNDEGQYSIWPDKKTVPAGWQQVHEAATKEACLAHINTVWTDMRPASLRAHMDAQAN